MSYIWQIYDKHMSVILHDAPKDGALLEAAAKLKEYTEPGRGARMNRMSRWCLSLSPLSSVLTERNGVGGNPKLNYNISKILYTIDSNIL